MYNKHTGMKTEYQLIIDNKVGIAFNTKAKRDEVIKKLKGTRMITCISNISYTWKQNIIG